MKIIPVGKHFINLDQVIRITPDKRLICTDNNPIQLTEDELIEFVKMYNLYDTDEVSNLAKKATQVLFTSPHFLTEEGLKGEIRRLVDQFDLKEFVKKYNNGKLLKELTSQEMVNLYKAIVEKINNGTPF